MDGSVDGRDETIIFRNAYKTSQVILTQGRFYQFFTNIINFNLQLGYHIVILKAILLFLKNKTRNGPCVDGCSFWARYLRSV